MSHSGVTVVYIVGILVISDGIGTISDDRITIEHRQTPESLQVVQVLVQYTYFYRLYIMNSAMVPTLTWDRLSNGDNYRMRKAHKWEWTPDGQLWFQKLRRVSANVAILQHFNRAKFSILLTNTSRIAISSVLNQYDSFGILRTVNCNSLKFFMPIGTIVCMIRSGRPLWKL